ncbi:MAG: 1-acyl-sn-glycerol-3-phosphate acyltransferase [Actinomycetia bacterium]|nr:1-acyl-sn-glycerol-3-phosphate acyltransferase [Actinomycetes bacterium]
MNFSLLPHAGPRRPTPGELAHRAAWPLTRRLFDLDRQAKHADVIVDDESVPLPPPRHAVLFAANHTNIADVPRIGYALDRPFYTVVARNAAFGVANTLTCYLFGTIWLTGGEATSKAKQKLARGQAVSKLRAGHNVLMFPESVMNPCHTWRDGTPLLPFHKGIVAIARTADAELIPVVTEYGPGGACYIRFGAPFDYRPYDDALSAAAALRDLMGEAKLALRDKYGTAPTKEAFLALRADWRAAYPFLKPETSVTFVEGYDDDPEGVAEWFLADEA